MMKIRTESSNLLHALSGGLEPWRIIQVLCLLLTVSSAQARTYKVLHRFTGKGDGEYPIAGVTRDSEGHIYGTTNRGGSFNLGAVFEIDVKGKEKILHSFWGGDGMYPDSTLIRDEIGDLWGVTSLGGAPKGGNCLHGCGAVFKLDTNGRETVLYVFTGQTDGREPSGLILGQNGTFYGTTAYGGDLNCADWNPGCGVVFSLGKNGKENTIFAFDWTDGTYPRSLVRDDAGNLYGVTGDGGAYNYGVVYKVDSAGNETVLYNFTGGADGGTPQGPLVQDATGNLYGVALTGGEYCCGTVFRVDSSGNETVVYSFRGKADGSGPGGGLIRDEHNNLYGTTYSGGLTECYAGYGCGTIFKVDTNGRETVLHRFSGGTGGSSPNGYLMIDESSTIYGTTGEGGDPSCGLQEPGCGVVFKLTP